MLHGIVHVGGSGQKWKWWAMQGRAAQGVRTAGKMGKQGMGMQGWTCWLFVLGSELLAADAAGPRLQRDWPVHSLRHGRTGVVGIASCSSTVCRRRGACLIRCCDVTSLMLMGSAGGAAAQVHDHVMTCRRPSSASPQQLAKCTHQL